MLSGDGRHTPEPYRAGKFVVSAQFAKKIALFSESFIIALNVLFEPLAIKYGSNRPTNSDKLPFIELRRSEEKMKIFKLSEVDLDYLVKIQLLVIFTVCLKCLTVS